MPVTLENLQNEQSMSRSTSSTISRLEIARPLPSPRTNPTAPEMCPFLALKRIGLPGNFCQQTKKFNSLSAQTAF